MKYILGLCLMGLAGISFGQEDGYSNTITGLLGVEKVRTYWDMDSTILRSEGYVNSKGWNDIGTKQGRWIFYYQNGKKQEIANYDRGQLNGKVSRFYENGKLQQTGWFKWGFQDSTYFSYFKNGAPAEEGNYSMGKEVGYWTVWYQPSLQFPEHQIKEQFEYNDSLKYLWNYWYENGDQAIENGEGLLESRHSEYTIKEKTT